MANEDLKRCIKCDQLLPLAEFHKSTNYTSGRMNACRDCKKVYQAELLARETPEHRAARLARHRERTFKWKRDNRAWVKEYTKRTTATNSARHKAWRKANPEKFSLLIKASDGRRRAARNDGATSKQTCEWIRLQKKACHWCGRKCAKHYHVDHIMPIARGGRHELHNLCIACPDCNLRKSARDPIEWAQMIGKLL